MFALIATTMASIRLLGCLVLAIEQGGQRSDSPLGDLPSRCVWYLPVHPRLSIGGRQEGLEREHRSLIRPRWIRPAGPSRVGNAAGVAAVQRQLNQAAGPLSLGIWGPAQDAVYCARMSLTPIRDANVAPLPALAPTCCRTHATLDTGEENLQQVRSAHEHLCGQSFVRDD